MSTTRPTNNDDNLTPQSAPNFLSSGNDQLNALRGDDVVRGDGGDDTLRGDGGMDALFGGDGRDHLFGGAEHDRLFGGDGRDRLEGGGGADDLVGGGGTDRFVYTDAGDIAGDRILDFDGTNAGDLVTLDGLGALANAGNALGRVSGAGQVGEGEIGLVDVGSDVRVVVNPVGEGRVFLVVEDIEIGGAGDTISLGHDFEIIA
jgi:Ca2+-binding RTX toxin-like protein